MLTPPFMYPVIPGTSGIIMLALWTLPYSLLMIMMALHRYRHAWVTQTGLCWLRAVHHRLYNGRTETLNFAVNKYRTAVVGMAAMGWLSMAAVFDPHTILVVSAGRGVQGDEVGSTRGEVQGKRRGEHCNW